MPHFFNLMMIEGSLEVKLPAIWTAEMGRVREEKKKENQKRGSLRRKKIQAREKVGKPRKIVFSNDLWLRRVEK